MNSPGQEQQPKQDAASSKKRLADGNQAREEKRRKWEAKQQRRKGEDKKQDARTTWVEQHSHYASCVTLNDVRKIKESPEEDMDRPQLRSLLEPYFDIQDKPSKKSRASSDEQLFIAEGTETIRILVQQCAENAGNGLSSIQVKSVFLKPSVLFEPPVNLLTDVVRIQDSKSEGSDEKSSPGFHLLVGPEVALSQVAGFPVSRGALACGVVPTDRNEEWLERMLATKVASGGGVRLLALDGICDTANLGSMIRSASAFGVDVIVMSHDCCDCWYRRAIRVSMGHVFKIPIVRVDNLSTTIVKWSSGDLNIRSYAAVIDTEKLLEKIPRGGVPLSWCCVMGNESKGVSPEVVAACSQKLRIDMVAGVDSLSVPMACGILLHGLKERETDS